jgi:hypothetical protein
MNKTRRVLVVAGAALALVVAAGAGYSLALTAQHRASVDGAATGQVVSSPPLARDKGALGAPDQATGEAYSTAVPQTGAEGLGAGDAAAPAIKMVIRNAAMSVRVTDLDKTLSLVRGIAARNGADIQSLTYTAGSPTPEPVPLAEGGAISEQTGPKSAQIVLRVPSEKLNATADAIAKTGTVLSQSASQDDVTQQYVDVKARLDNLKAQEVRLRGFFAKAKRVSELIDVERELARVRGEIEAMQAQVDYLSRQAAMATLTVDLTEPGPIVSPQGTSWGIGDAFTAGIRAAVGIVNGMIVVSISALPILILGIVVFVVVRALLRRSARRHASAHSTMGEQAEETTD